MGLLINVVKLAVWLQVSSLEKTEQVFKAAMQKAKQLGLNLADAVPFEETSEPADSITMNVRGVLDWISAIEPVHDGDNERTRSRKQLDQKTLGRICTTLLPRHAKPDAVAAESAPAPVPQPEDVPQSQPEPAVAPQPESDEAAEEVASEAGEDDLAANDEPAAEPLPSSPVPLSSLPQEPTAADPVEDEEVEDDEETDLD